MNKTKDIKLRNSLKFQVYLNLTIEEVVELAEYLSGRIA